MAAEDLAVVNLPRVQMPVEAEALRQHIVHVRAADLHHIAVCSGHQTCRAVRFGGAEVISFSKLTELIAPHQPGDEVEIEVVRRIFNDQGGDARKISTKVTLAGWEAEAAVRNTRR